MVDKFNKGKNVHFNGFISAMDLPLVRFMISFIVRLMARQEPVDPFK